MKNFSLPIVMLFVLLDIYLFGLIITKNFHLILFDPAGLIAQKQSQLFLFIGTLGLTIIGSVIITTFFIVWKYREGNSPSSYHPEWSGSKKLMLFWWILPACIILFVSSNTWKSTHELDPFKPIISAVKPLRIQVVSLQWKWLFIYPDQHIATINYFVFPEKTPLNFELTADSPMNSFWIPRLGGQMYSMSGMVTRTHLIANQTGEFSGSSAEISGAGFTGMRFVAKSTTDAEFTDWVKQVKQSPQILTQADYEKLTKPSENNKVMLYSTVDESLYNSIVMKYMASPHMDQIHTMHDMPGM